MAMASSSRLLLRRLSRTRIHTSNAFSRSCSRCDIRHYSDHHDVTNQDQINDQLEQPIAGSSSSSSSTNSSDVQVDEDMQKKGRRSTEKTKSKDFFELLMQEDVHIQPSLNALDELRPRFHKPYTSKGRSQDAWKFESDIDRTWKTTLEKVKRSFTAPQLEQFCKEVNVPKELYKLYNVRPSKNVAKDVRARLLLVHRFRMEDPKMVEKRAKIRSEKNNKYSEVSTTDIALLLLALRAQNDVQRLLQYFRVRLRPVRKTDDDGVVTGIVLALQGSEEGIKEVERWIHDFNDRIQSTTYPVSTFAFSEAPDAIPDSRRLRQISQLSKAAVSLDYDSQSITIHSLDEASLRSAKSLLVQFYQNVRHCQEREYYSYASPSVSLKTQYSVPTFAFEPNVGISPMPWLSDPSATSSLFRVIRQDVFDARVSPFSLLMHDDPDRPILRNAQIPERYDSTAASKSLSSEVFEDLRNQVAIDNDATIGSWSFKAEFGNLLMNNLNKASSSKILSLISPPLSGSWPLEHVLYWLREGKGKDMNAEPTFVPNIPPIAVSMDAGVASASTVAPGLDDGNNLTADERIERKSEYWSNHIRRMGYNIGALKNDLSDIVDLTSSDFTEAMMVSFAGKEADLVIEMRREEIQDESFEQLMEESGMNTSGWTFHRAEWIKQSRADILVPEAPIDLRLAAQHSTLLQESDLVQDEGLRQLLKGESAKSMVESQDDIEDVNPKEEQKNDEVFHVDAPSSAVVQGKTVQLSSAKVTSRWSWNLLGDSASKYQGKLVLERNAADTDFGYTSSLKVEFNECSEKSLDSAWEGDEETSLEGRGMEESDVEKNTSEVEDEKFSTMPRWQEMQPFVNLFLAKQYRSLQGR